MTYYGDDLSLVFVDAHAHDRSDRPSKSPELDGFLRKLFQWFKVAGHN